MPHGPNRSALDEATEHSRDHRSPQGDPQGNLQSECGTHLTLPATCAIRQRHPWALPATTAGTPYAATGSRGAGSDDVSLHRAGRIIRKRHGSATASNTSPYRAEQNPIARRRLRESRQTAATQADGAVEPVTARIRRQIECSPNRPHSAFAHASQHMRPRHGAAPLRRRCSPRDMTGRANRSRLALDANGDIRRRCRTTTPRHRSRSRSAQRTHCLPCHIVRRRSEVRAGAASSSLPRGSAIHAERARKAREMPRPAPATTDPRNAAASPHRTRSHRPKADGARSCRTVAPRRTRRHGEPQRIGPARGHDAIPQRE